MKTAKFTAMSRYPANTAVLTVTGLLTLILAGMTGSGCAPVRQSSPSTAASIAPQDATFCVMPFFKGRHPEQTDRSLERTFTCPLAELSVNNKTLVDEANRIVYQQVHQAMADRFKGRVASIDATRPVHDRLTAECNGETIRSLAQALGENLKTDYVVAGTVWRFREREGYALSAQQPASVGFAVFLLNVKESKIIWTGVFNRTQQALSDNLLNAVSFFKQGAKWLTARELSRVGVAEVFNRFPIRGQDQKNRSDK
ncbi:MAG: hypothetical protein SWH68_15165 [Thermodesulfobacteriota bacterium]|nr:hypothetical protein [Thermodesulfobacteriota bacterium]